VHQKNRYFRFKEPGDPEEADPLGRGVPDEHLSVLERKRRRRNNGGRRSSRRSRSS
jgi:hypothetical protein